MITLSSFPAHIGDTLHRVGEVVEPMAGFQPAKAMVCQNLECTSQNIDTLLFSKVFAGVYPIENSEFPKLEESINRVNPSIVVNMLTCSSMALLSSH